MKNSNRIFLILINFLTTATMITTAQVTGKYADVNGLHMYYEIHGSGKPLVLVHGGGSTIPSNWSNVLPALAKTHMVIAMELQAHGRTVDNGRVTTFEQDADDIAELLKQLQIKDADVLGFSNGGNTTMRLATRHPELVHKIVIASAFYQREGMIPGFWDGMKNASLAGMPKGLQESYLKVSPRPQDLQIMFDRDAKRMINFKDWSDEDIKSINAPALIVAADNDVMTPEHALKMYRLLQHGSLTIFPGFHGEYLGEIEAAKQGSKMPELFVELVNEFLKKTNSK